MLLCVISCYLLRINVLFILCLSLTHNYSGGIPYPVTKTDNLLARIAKKHEISGESSTYLYTSSVDSVDSGSLYAGSGVMSTGKLV